jgi:hypothetical protein
MSRVYHSNQEPLPTATVKNDSTYTVSFRLQRSGTGGTENLTLPAGESRVIDNAYASVLSFSSTPKPWVTYDKNDSEIVFRDADPITVKIENHFFIDISLSANGYMENDPLSVEKNDCVTGTIYTKTPSFTVDANGFPAEVKYNIANDGIMYVVVR